MSFKSLSPRHFRALLCAERLSSVRSIGRSTTGPAREQMFRSCLVSAGGHPTLQPTCSRQARTDRRETTE
jgi:hypothetical protein